MSSGRNSRLHATAFLRATRLAVFSFAALAFASEGPGRDPEDSSKWVEMSVDQNADYWQRANWSSDEWVVYLREGRPSVRTQKRSEDDRGKLPFAVAKGFRNVQVAKVADGWIVASNYGEFGAELWWFSPEGKSRYQISREHVRGFLQNDRELFALEGLAHKGIDRGQVLRIVRGSNGKWRSERVVDLGSEPGAATRDKDGSLIIVTNTRLVRVRVGKPVETLLDDMFWDGLYPNSIVVDSSGTVYIGMRKGVAKATLKGTKTLSLVSSQVGCSICVKPAAGYCGSAGFGTARSAAANPHALCWPSQNGLFCDWPQRHRATVSLPAMSN